MSCPGLIICLRWEHCEILPGRSCLGAVEWTYAKADEEVNERAARFRRLSSGLPVCLRAVNSPSWVLNLLALLRANIPAILIPSELTDREIKALIQVAGTQFKLDGGQMETTSIKPASMPEWLGQDVGVGFTTSGSTGEPRIALRSHPSLTDEGQRYQLLWEATPDDVFLAPAPLYHAYTFGAALAAALTAGATLIPLVFKSPQLVSRQIQEFGATIMPLVPAMARMLAVVDQGKPLQSKLRIVMAGAGQTTDEISTLFSLRWGRGTFTQLWKLGNRRYSCHSQPGCGKCYWRSNARNPLRAGGKHRAAWKPALGPAEAASCGISGQQRLRTYPDLSRRLVAHG